MSSSNPQQNGGPTSTTAAFLEVQRLQPALSPVNNEREPGGDDQKDATALQTLEEASFVKPTLPPTVHQSTTLLPFPFAKIVSTTTGLTTLTIRTYARAFEWGIGLGKETTLRSLELTRAGIEIVLKASAKDVTNRRENSSELARADTENVLARSISALHWAFTSACFATSAGFNISELYLRGAETAALQGLSALNAILGDTESSRAVSAIITLSKEELTRPGAEDGIVPKYWDLIVGVVSFVILQRWGRRKTALEFRGNGGEETIWDLVINDKGFRADVVGTKRVGGAEITATKSFTAASARMYEDHDDNLVLEGGLDLHMPPNVALSAQDQTNLSDSEIRDRIVAQLPPGTRAVITTNTLTLKTVQVDIHGAETAHIEAPPGLTMVSEELGTDAVDPEQPHQTIVFRTSLKRNSSAEIEPIEKLKLTSVDQESHGNGEYDDMGMVMNPPKRRKSFGSQNERLSIDYPNGLEPFPKLRVDHNGPVANQKKTRKPVWSVGQSSENKPGVRTTNGHREKDTNKVAKAGMIKKALQSLNPTQSSSNQPKQQSEALAAASRKETGLVPLSRVTDPNQPTKRLYPMPEGMDQSTVTSPDRSPSARREHSTSYFTMHEKRRESTVSQTDSFSIHSAESRPGSPNSYKTRARADSGLTRTKSHTEFLTQPIGRAESDNASSGRHHVRSRSFVPSLYSMGTKHSNEAIILQPKTPVHRSMFEDHKMLTALANDGKVPGMFPDRHLVKSIHRFSRFASASYGSNFLRVMGITSPDSSLSKSSEMMVEEIHHEHSSFATHTGLPADTILLSGFCDPHGGPVTVSRDHPTMTPLMHFISVDHDSRAIVLTCRGTLGFEDVLTDMTCGYDDIHWRGQTYQVHKGIHASARRLLDGGGRRVMRTIQGSLEEFPDYGLILCGHSLGGAVAAVLALLISEPNKRRQGVHGGVESEVEAEPSFVTAPPMKLLTDGSATPSASPIVLPAGRAIHVFAYGPPASFSPSLRLATRGLITTIINHNDIVCSLSLGNLHDFKAIANHLKQDPSSPLVRLRATVIEKVKYAMLGHFWNRENSPPRPVPSAGISVDDNDEEWQWTALSNIRNLMINDKLLPPGEIFMMETSQVFDRLDAEPDASSVPGSTPGDSAYRPLGRPATRVQFKLIRNVESRFREIRFGSGMFGDHSPGRYEGGLAALEKGIFEEI